MERGKVYNMWRGAPQAPADAVRIDRQTQWGNPIKMYEEQHRERVLAAYEVYLGERLTTDPIFRAQVAELAGKPLKCWCSPAACHGDILARVAVEITKEGP